MIYFVVIYDRISKSNKIYLTTTDYKLAVKTMSELTEEGQITFIDYTDG